MSLGGIQLCCGGWEAEILPFFGANLISLKKDGRSILRTPDSIEKLKESPCLYGNPILFPPNRTSGGHFNFQGKEYQLPINEPRFRNNLHGLIYNAPFRVQEVSDRYLVCTLKNEGEWFPFAFTMTVSFSLHDDGLTQQVTIHNDGNQAMPVLLGFHTSFLESKSFSVQIKKAWETDDRHLPTGNMRNLNEYESLIRKGCPLHSQAISAYYSAEGNSATIDNFVYQSSPDFTQWVLYNGGGDKGFICIEPQTGPVNGLNIPDGHTVLPAGETAVFWVRFMEK